MSIGKSAPGFPGAKPPSPAAPATPVGGVTHLNGPMLTPPAAPTPAPSPEGEEPKAPADLVRAPGLWERVAWYAGAVVVTCVVLFAGLRLDTVDLRAPLSYDGDVLLIMPMVKATLERGSHWRNERMGYPGVMELHDFPVIDHLHLALIWVIGRVVPDWVVVYNLYFLLTWPLTTLTAMLAFRHLRLTLPVAAVGGLLYAFQPYHYMRNESHYFLAAYWVIPLTWLPALAVCKGDLPFFRRDPGGTYRLDLLRWGTLGQVLLAAATASAGAYYAFFACAIYGFVGVYGWVVHRTWKAAASAAVLVGLVGAFGVANHLPTFAYAAANGRNSATERQAHEAEHYALKIAHLVLPIDGHNLTLFGRIKSSYNSAGRPLNNENTCASLGLVGAVGVVGLLAALVLPVRRTWPLGPLAALAGFIVLFATIGGAGSLFNLLVMDQVRCYNRFSIYLAFIALFAALWPLDRFLATRTGWARRLRYPAVVGLAVLGIIDQTPTAWFGKLIVEDTRREAARFESDREFFGRVEEMMPAGARVFCIPYIQFPEVPPLYEMNTYEHARGYLLTNTLVWGYGAMKNREVDSWQESVAHDARHQLLRRVVVRGFDGIFIDKRGFLRTHRDEGDALIADLQHAAESAGRVKLPVIFHKDGRQAFVDVRPYRDWLRTVDPVQFEAWAREEREWATMTWLDGFFSPEPYGHKNDFRWGQKRGTAAVVNPADRTRKFELAVTFGVDAPGEFRIRIDGGGLTQLNKPGGPGPWAEEFTVTKPDPPTGARRDGVNPDRRTYLLEVPPGHHLVTFRCTVPDKFMPGEARPLCYYLRDITFREVK